MHYVEYRIRMEIYNEKHPLRGKEWFSRQDIVQNWVDLLLRNDVGFE